MHATRLSARALLGSLAFATLLSGCEFDSDDGKKFRSSKFEALDCLVVAVEDDNFLEEGLGSIYDFDRDGFGFADGDSIDVGIRRSDLSELDNELLLSIGQLTIGLHSDKDVIEQVPSPEDLFNDSVTWRGLREGADEFVILRVFDVTKLGWVYWQFTPEVAEGCTEDAQADCIDEHIDGSDEEEFERCLRLAQRRCEAEVPLARVDCREGIEPPLFDEL